MTYDYENIISNTLALSWQDCRASHMPSAQITSQSFVFQNLPYDYDALEPYIDATTMEIHYSRHHRAYYNNFLNAVKGTEMEKMAIEDIFANISAYPQAIRNNGGGYYSTPFSGQTWPQEQVKNPREAGKSH